MSKVIAVTSGKGGVGKSTFCTHFGRALAAKGKKTIIVEFDSGLRGLDIMLNVSDTVYDLGDVIEGRCSLRDAITLSDDTGKLFLLPAPAKFSGFLRADELEILCKALRSEFDQIVLDVPAGMAMAEGIAKVSDLILLLVTPDPICVRDVSFYAHTLKEELKAKAEIRLVINRAQRDTIKHQMIKNFDEIIDQVSAQLIGVLPELKEIYLKTASGQPLKAGSLEEKIFSAIADRTLGNHVFLYVG